MHRVESDGKEALTSLSRNGYGSFLGRRRGRGPRPYTSIVDRDRTRAIVDRDRTRAALLFLPRHLGRWTHHGLRSTCRQFGFYGQMSFENVCRRRINRLHGPKGIMGRRYIHHRCHPGWWINRGGGYSCRRCPGKNIHHPVIIHQPWVASQARWWIYLFSQKA